MRAHEIENWVLKIIEQVESGQPHILRDYPRRVMNKLDGWITDLRAIANLPEANQEAIDIEGQSNRGESDDTLPKQ